MTEELNNPLLLLLKTIIIKHKEIADIMYSISLAISFFILTSSRVVMKTKENIPHFAYNFKEIL